MVFAYASTEKEQKRIQQMLIFYGGRRHSSDDKRFYGVIIDITDEDVIVEFGNNKTVVFRCRKLRLLRLKNRMQIDFKSIILHYEIRENFEIFSKFSLIFFKFITLAREFEKITEYTLIF